MAARDFDIERGFVGCGKVAHVYAGGNQLGPGEYEIAVGASVDTVSVHAKVCQCGEWSFSLFVGIGANRWSVQAFNDEEPGRPRVRRARFVRTRAIIANALGAEVRVVIPA